MPDMLPVGDKIIPPNPQAGISSIAGILGLRQQQQQLATGAQTLAQEQLKTAQQRGIQSFFQNWDPSNHVGDDGTTDLDSALQSKEFQAAGNAKPAIMQSLLDIKQKQLGAKQSLSSLNKDLVDQFGTAVGALAGDDDVKADKTDQKTGVNAGRAKVNTFLTNFSKLSPDAARVAGIYSPMLQHIPPGKLGNAIAALQLQAQSASEQQAQQNPVPGSLDTGTQTLLTTTNRATGIQTPTGQVVNRQQVVKAPGGQVAVATPASGTMAPLGNPPGSTGPNINPNLAQVETQTGLARGVTERVSQALNQANNTIQAQDALSRAKTILESENGPNTGAAFEKLKGMKNLFASLGIDTEGATDANSLVKNLARYEAARATAAGLGATDAARELAHNGSPNTQIDKNALIGIVNQSLATEKAIAAYASKQAKAGSDPDKLTANENAFRSIPNLIEGYEYGMSRNAQEANQFLGKHGISPAEMKRTRELIKQFETQ